ncbi:MAG TPA: DUF4381 family protein [Chthoniobacterales bacterium]
MLFFAVEQFHDIAPPVDYSLLKPWVIVCVILAVLVLIGFVTWLVFRLRQRPIAVSTVRDRALAQLEYAGGEIEKLTPYQFSIRVSDILRGYVTEQFQLPVTRQTSVEFLNAIAAGSLFSPDEKALLEEFLNRCDLIKFARFEATTNDSRLLLEEATRFVKGGQLEPA